MSDEVASRAQVSGATNLRDAQKLVDTDFWDAHPTLTMRLTYIRLKQQNGQKFSDYAAELKKQGELADVKSMTPDSWEVMVMTNGCVDRDLLQKIIESKEEDMAYNKIVERAKLNEAQTSVYDDILKSQTKKRSEWIRRAGPDTACWRCCRPGHMHDRCSVPAGELKCTKCSREAFKSRPHNESDWCRRRADKSHVRSASRFGQEAEKGGQEEEEEEAQGKKSI